MNPDRTVPASTSSRPYVPQVELSRYITELRTATQGLGTYSWRHERLRSGARAIAPWRPKAARIARPVRLRSASLAALGRSRLSACTQGRAGDRRRRAAVTRGRKPDVLRIAIQTDVKNLNPLLNSNTTDVFVDRFMFEPLLTADPKGNPVPMLATQVPTLENGGISRDGLTITYHLRPDAKWTDGVPVTSQDVKWSWQAIMNPNNNVVSRHGYDYIQVDRHARRYDRRRASQRRSSRRSSTRSSPRATSRTRSRRRTCSSKYPNINQIPFNSAPTVSDGPFKFVELVARRPRSRSCATTASSWASPSSTRIDIKIVPDENTSVNLLKTHAID